MLFKPVFVAYLMVCLAAIMGTLCVGCDARRSTGASMSVMRAYTDAQVEAKRRRAPAARRQQLDQHLQSFIRDMRSDMVKHKGKHISERIQRYGPASEITSDSKGGSVYKWRAKDIMPSPYWKKMWIDLFYYTDPKGIIYHTLARGAVY